MENVAIYCRVSTEEQRERQSIEIQIQHAKEHCQRNELLITDFYLDDGVSGTIPFDARPEGKRLLDDAKENNFKNVLIWKIDRLGRDTKNSLIIAHSLRDLGIGIISMTEPFDTSTAMGEFMFTQLASFAKLERDNIRERSIAGTNRVAKLGKWLGGIVPYGYLVDKDKNLVVSLKKIYKSNYSESDVIKMIYEWIGKEGLSTLEVARKLNALNIPPHYTKDNRKFYKPAQNLKPSERELEGKGKIGNLLKNTTYKGIHYYGKRSKEPREIIEREVPAIVSPELWNKAQETLRNNFLWSKRNSKREYLLRGLINCGICGRNLSGAYRKPTVWYRCNGKLSHVEIGAGKKVCTLKSVRAEWIENLVWNDIKDWILRPESLESVLQQKLEEYEQEKGSYFQKINSLKSKLESKEEERSKILGLYRKGHITMEDVGVQLQDIEKDKTELQLIIDEAKNKLVGDYSTKEVINEIKSQLKFFQGQIESENMSFDIKRKIIELFVKDVRVHLTKGNKHSVLIDTIPFREGVDLSKRTKAMNEVDTVYMRFSNGNEQEKTQESQSDTINICYRFPLPYKQISSIVDRTGRDSSQSQALELPDMLLK